MATRHNLCLNPALGVDVTGWGGGSTPARTAVTGFNRPWAARYVAGTFMSTAATSSGAVTAGLDYTLAIQLRVATFAVPSGVIYVEWINAGGTGFGYPSAGFTASIGTVVRVSITATAPANAVAARVVVDGINYNINTADFTMLLIEQTAAADTYFDGDSPSASWDGTAGLSSSTLTDTQISAVTARSTIALSGAASARKLAPATGQATAGLAGTSAARKISPVISTAAAAITGSSTARKTTPAEGRAAVAISGTAAARKTTPAAAASYALLGGHHSQVTSRAVTGISSLALTSRATTAKVARTSSSTTIALTSSAAAHHVAAASGTSSILLAGNAAGTHLATATGSASLLLTGATAPRRITAVTGRGVLLLTTRMANVSDPGLPAFTVGPPQLRWHAGPPRIGRP